jgi:hypothetical protein
MTRIFLDAMGVLYVDDTDLYIADKCIHSHYDLCQESQGALSVWGELLISTGGMLKYEKCFYYMIDYECQEDGTWIAHNMIQPARKVTQKDGATASILQLSSTEPRKTLGIWTNPAGLCT